MPPAAAVFLAGLLSCLSMDISFFWVNMAPVQGVTWKCASWVAGVVVFSSEGKAQRVWSCGRAWVVSVGRKALMLQRSSRASPAEAGRAGPAAFPLQHKHLVLRLPERLLCLLV